VLLLHHELCSVLFWADDLRECFKYVMQQVEFVYDAVSNDLVSSCSSASYTNRYTKRFAFLLVSECSSVSISMEIGNS
jgi:hypothetical protein